MTRRLGLTVLIVIPAQCLEHQREEVQMSNLGMAGVSNNLLWLGVQNLDSRGEQ